MFNRRKNIDILRTEAGHLLDANELNRRLIMAACQRLEVARQTLLSTASIDFDDELYLRRTKKDPSYPVRQRVATLAEVRPSLILVQGNCTNTKNNITEYMLPHFDEHFREKRGDSEAARSSLTSTLGEVSLALTEVENGVIPSEGRTHFSAYHRTDYGELQGHAHHAENAMGYLTAALEANGPLDEYLQYKMAL